MQKRFLENILRLGTIFLLIRTVQPIIITKNKIILDVASKE